MTVLPPGISPRFVARLATSSTDLQAAQGLRARVFRGPGAGIESDPFDQICAHILIEEVATGGLVACYRCLHLQSGAEIERTYAAQFYDLSRLAAYPGPMLEIGRFCVDPDVRDADVLRVAWASITAYVDRHGVQMLFGCSSFPGTDAGRYRDAFSLLRAQHASPARWRPGKGAAPIFDFGAGPAVTPDLRRARATIPPLLHTYLKMGGWVSGHAVIDADLGTLHVFTAVEIGAVPPARARLLRALAAQTGQAAHPEAALP